MSDDKPDLAAVLDHYGVAYHEDRASQKVLCPIVAETRPSCSIDFDKQLWNCYGCGAGGDTWNLIMLKEGCSFVAAFEIAKGIARAGGGSVPAAVDTRAEGLLGRAGVQRRDDSRRTFRPSLRGVERP